MRTLDGRRCPSYYPSLPPLADDVSLSSCPLCRAICRYVRCVVLSAGGVGPKAWPAQHRFDLLPNVIMSPHASSATPMSRQYSLESVAANLDNFARGLPLDNIIRNATGKGKGSSRPSASKLRAVNAVGPISEGHDRPSVRVQLAGPSELTKLVAGQVVSFHDGEGMAGAPSKRFKLVQIEIED
jgi:hypothetical protein